MLVVIEKGVNNGEWRSQNRPTFSLHPMTRKCTLNACPVGYQSGLTTLGLKDNTRPVPSLGCPALASLSLPLCA